MGDPKSPTTLKPPTQEEIESLTQPLRPDEKARVFRLECCRDFVVGNWEKIIPQAQEILLQVAEEDNDTDFLQIIEKIQR